MELIAVLVIPALACAFSLSSIGRRRAPLVTVLASVLVLALSVRIAMVTVATGRASAAAGWLTCDGLGALILVLVAFVGFTAALFSWGYVAHRAAHSGHGGIRTYYGLYNLFLMSMLAVPIMANIALMWIAIELTTLLSAFLVGFEDTAAALEAAWKYVILTSLGAILALLGLLILYWGSLIAGPEPFTWTGLTQAAPGMKPALLWIAFLLILVGFGAKVGLVPMHTWLPDAHSQAPAPICALLSGVETTTVLYVILRLFPVLGMVHSLDARPWYIVCGLISVGVATLLLLYVRDYKRMFAFSTVEHMGIILVAAGLGSADAHFGAVYQIAAHSLAKSFCFLAAGTVVMTVGSQEIASVRGLARLSPIAAMVLLAGGLAIAGVPPFAVFISEFLIVKAGLASGQYIAIGLLAFFIIVAFCAILSHINRLDFGMAREGPALAGIPRSCRVALAVAALPLFIIGFYVPLGLQGLLKAAATAMGG